MIDFEYKFTSDWFSSNIEHLEKILCFMSNKPVKALEIGSYEGKSAVWFCENILTHPESQIFCVDVFDSSDYSDIRDPQNYISSYERFSHNMSPFGNKVNVFVGPSFVALKAPDVLAEKFHFIYIDGDHRAVGVLEDAVLSFRLLKIGGFLIFDDYLGGNEKMGTAEAPKKGIDAFCDFYSDKIEVVFSGYQLIIKKVSE